jgi:PHP family Zn ribbon phosphoesterase
MTEILKFSTQFLMIVDFAVENDDAIPVIAQDGLVPGLSVYNLEACRAKRDNAGLEDVLLVRSTVDKRGRYTADSVRIRRPIAMRKAYNSAQKVIPPFCPP